MFLNLTETTIYGVHGLLVPFLAQSEQRSDSIYFFPFISNDAMSTAISKASAARIGMREVAHRQ